MGDGKPHVLTCAYVGSCCICRRSLLTLTQTTRCWQHCAGPWQACVLSRFVFFGASYLRFCEFSQIPSAEFGQHWPEVQNVTDCERACHARDRWRSNAEARSFQFAALSTHVLVIWILSCNCAIFSRGSSRACNQNRVRSQLPRAGKQRAGVRQAGFCQ